MPACTRRSPHRQVRKALLTEAIPAYSRSARKHHDRPVTPEVAGSSPVAPAQAFACKRAGRVVLRDARPRFRGPIVAQSRRRKSLQIANFLAAFVCGRTTKSRSCA